jgi:phospholipase C
MSPLSRSQFLSATVGAAVASRVDWVRPVLAQTSTAKLGDIDHIVILMQENRSFDHYYGTMSGVRGYDDTAVSLLPDGRPVFYQPDPLNPDGYVLPFRLDTKTTSAQRLHDLSHAWTTLHHSWNDGKFDGWVSSHRESDGSSGPLTMGHYTRDDIPFYYALADAFTICDGYHASVIGPTDPNRYYWMTGTIDPNGQNGGPVTTNRDKRYTWETYPERLERAGISWRIYRPERSLIFPVGLDVIMNFPAFADAQRNSTYYENAAKIRSVDTLLNDIRTSNIPQVTWIVPPYELCEHPDMLPAAGEDYVRRILEAFWLNKTLWSKTAFVIVYDENDGLFDHVVPPTPPPGTPDEYVHGAPIGLGFRVPCLVLSPFSRGGYVYGGTLDHTSTLRLIEARFGAEIPNLSSWRRETCGDMLAAFGFNEAADFSIPELPETAQALTTIEHQVAHLPRPVIPSVQAMPKQATDFARRRRA